MPHSSPTIAHPRSIPVHFAPLPRPTAPQPRQGLCVRFYSNIHLGTGLNVAIHVPSLAAELQVQGWVQACRQRGRNRFTILIQFPDPLQAQRIRMLEQVCHILAYQQQCQRRGLRLSTEQAAQEWIHQHAAQFPGVELDC
ncbi:hypothetical protein [Balneatrix alpica]|uniref:Uncharacterized protein n=1 Tax=Balneatrix alpica TaxID=75684 RepID=A0ABV5Z6D3_9GAMM|nr:hypothetical protein [Balneatrix alpica]